MKLKFLKSASVIIEESNTKILCDPWLYNSEYYGSWSHLDNYDSTKLNKSHIDYIYISHIHPDHFSKESLKRFSKSIKIIIHKYAKPFLRKNIESLGFEVVELNNAEKYKLSNNFNIEIISADNCNPVLCAKFFGCEVFKSSLGSNQIDTISIFSNKNNAIVNVNDCPFEMSKSSLEQIKLKYKKIGLLLTGYSGAGPYPQNFQNLSVKEKKIQASIKQQNFLNQSLNFINFLNPNNVIPFAGTYFLSGKKLAKLNKYRGVPSRFEAVQYIANNVKDKNIKTFALETDGSFNLLTNKIYKKIKEDNEKIDVKKTNKLSKIKLSYESDKMPSQLSLISLLKKACGNFYKKLDSVKYKNNVNILISIGKKQYFLINTKTKSSKSKINIIPKNNYLVMNIDTRLLVKILLGPKYAHWNNAEIGSHIMYLRNPDIYDRQLFYCLNFLHT